MEFSLEESMAHRKPPQWQPTQVLAPPCCNIHIMAAKDGLLQGFMGGIRMVLRLLLLLGICAFSAFVGLLSMTLLIDAVRVLFTTFIPSALLGLHFLLSALLLLFCLQWMTEVLSQQFRRTEPLGDASLPPWQPTPVLATPSCQSLPPAARDRLLHGFMGGIQIALRVMLFMGTCAFAAYLGLVCVTLLVGAGQVFFTSLVPSALPVLHFLLSALLLLVCLQWMSELLFHLF